MTNFEKWFEENFVSLEDKYNIVCNHFDDCRECFFCEIKGNDVCEWYNPKIREWLESEVQNDY